MIESDLTEETKITFAKKKAIRLVVKYEKKVDDKCVNQMSRNSSGNFTEHWLVWLANRQLSTLTKTLESLANLMFNTDSNEQHHEIRALCVLQVVRTTDTTPEYNSGIPFPLFAPGQLSELGREFNKTFCNTEGSYNLQPCLNISTSDENTTTNSKGLFERGGWPVAIFKCLCLVLLSVYNYYSPAYFCLFSPTEVIEDGVPKIVLEGASPASFRSLIGNYFFSQDDTICHRARTFVLRAVVLPLHFLGPAIFLDYLQHKNWFSSFNILGVSHLLQPFMIVCYLCYFILAFNISFFNARFFNEGRPCFVCKFFKPKMRSCQDKIPRLITNHLRMQPLILAECWRMLIRCFLNYCKMFVLVLPFSSKVSATFFLRLSVFMTFLFTFPAVTVIILTAILLVALISIVLISPICTLCGITKFTNIYSRYRSFQMFSLLVSILAFFPAAIGAAVVILWAGFGIVIAIVLVFALLLSEKILPFAACFVLVLYYLWSSYSSFTNKYQDLALALFKHYKKSRNDKCENTCLNKSQVQENIPIAINSDHNMMRIPKELFHMACEELMPIREGVCIMILKVTTIVTFVLFVFSLTMLLNVGATPVMKALLTFLTGSFPKIVAIYIDGGRQKKIDAVISDEKIPIITQEYINRTALLNQKQENCGEDADVVILLNENEMNIELVTCKAQRP